MNKYQKIIDWIDDYGLEILYMVLFTVTVMSGLMSIMLWIYIIGAL